MKKTFEVANIRCGGCANTITTKLEAEGFKGVKVDLSCEPRKVTVVLENEALEAQLISTLRKLGYPLTTDTVGKLDAVGLKAKSFVSCAVGKIGQNENNNES